MSPAGWRVAQALPVLVGWSTLAPGLAEACSVCIGPGSEERGLTAGFYWSALFLTLLPFALAVALALSIGGVVRRVDSRSAPEEMCPPVVPRWLVRLKGARRRRPPGPITRQSLQKLGQRRAGYVHSRSRARVAVSIVPGLGSVFQEEMMRDREGEGLRSRRWQLEDALVQ